MPKHRSPTLGEALEGGYALVVESGHGDRDHRAGVGERLVLIHGFSGTRLMWEPVLEALERSHNVLAVNLAGHVGGPELADRRVSVNALVDVAGWFTS